MSKHIWQEVTVNGGSLCATVGKTGVTITPEYLTSLMASTARPDEYREGDVKVELSYEDTALLFGEVTATYTREAQ